MSTIRFCLAPALFFLSLLPASAATMSASATAPVIDDEDVANYSAVIGTDIRPDAHGNPIGVRRAISQGGWAEWVPIGRGLDPKRHRAEHGVLLTDPEAL